MRWIASILCVFVLFSCKAKKNLVTNETVVATVANESVENIIKNHDAVKYNFTTAYIKSDVDYEDPKQSLHINAEIRIKKDEIILVSLRWFGITMAKAMITPTQVKYYEKINGKYFEGDYKMLSDLFGTDLDFQKVQNVLLGKAIEPLSKGKFNMTLEGNNPKLEEMVASNFTKSYVFNSVSFWLQKQEVKQSNPNRTFAVNYLDYKTYSASVFPTELAIFAIQENKTTTINIRNKNVNFNEELTFPYSVPNGYEKISLQ